MVFTPPRITFPSSSEATDFSASPLNSLCPFVAGSGSTCSLTRKHENSELHEIRFSANFVNLSLFHVSLHNMRRRRMGVCEDVFSDSDDATLLLGYIAS